MMTLLKLFLGNLLVLLQPNKAQQLATNGMTLVIDDSLSFRERLMRGAILAKAELAEDDQALAQYHHDYWKNRGTEYFELTDDNFESVFMPDCSFVFDILEEKLQETEHEFTTLVEIGAGNGDITNYLSEKFPQIKQFIGIDLSEAQTEKNREKYKDHPKLNFVAGDAFEWIENNGSSNMIFVTSRGVLEYFTQKRLLVLLKMISFFNRVIFVAIEPNGLDHDFMKNPGSQPYGNERSFSHNYMAYFKEAGFELAHISRKVYAENDHSLSFIVAQSGVD